LQANPLQMQASHLTFQEYFAVCALCEEGTVLLGVRPWQWTVWWANAVKMGEEVGQPFARGLLRAAGVKVDSLDLSGGRLGGDRPTTLRVVVLFTAVLTTLDLERNYIGAEGAKALANALASGRAVLTSLDVSSNSLDEEAALAIVRAVKPRDKMTRLGLASSKIGPTGATEIAEYVKVSAVLTSLNLAYNQLCGVDLDGRGTYDASGIQALASAISVNAVLTTLDLRGNNIGAQGATALADALASGRAVLKQCDLRYNSMGGEVKAALQEAVKGREGFELLL